MDGWVWERRPQDVPVATSTLAGSGLKVVWMTQPLEAGLRETQAAIAAVLELPTPAERNLDAFADSLRDVRTWWGGEAVALLWEEADRLRRTDARAYRLLTAILDEARVPTISVVDQEPEEPPAGGSV